MMKTNPVRRHAVVVAALFLGVGCLTLAVGAPAEASSKREAAKPAKPPLEQGMSAEDIRKLIGEPREIKRIAADETAVSAEKWIYRRKVRTETTQEPLSSVSQPAFVGMGMGDANGLGTVEVPVYRLKHTTLYQITALLMVDGELVTARQWIEQEVNYEG